jgi:hypothetical protein
MDADLVKYLCVHEYATSQMKGSKDSHNAEDAGEALDLLAQYAEECEEKHDFLAYSEDSDFQQDEQRAAVMKAAAANAESKLG